MYFQALTHSSHETIVLILPIQFGPASEMDNFRQLALSFDNELVNFCLQIKQLLSTCNAITSFLMKLPNTSGDLDVLHLKAVGSFTPIAIVHF